MNFKIIEIKPRIFFLDFKNRYDLTMTFLRYQEYYESPNSKFRGKQFILLDFIKWYTKAFGDGNFTYMNDWDGTNIPGHIISDIHKKGILDYNSYDHEMKKVHDKFLKKYPDGKFYIIGAVGQSFAMKHEIAHALFYIDKSYKKKMTKLVKELDPAFKAKLFKELKRIGYASKVYVDECQAYLATGLTDAFEINIGKEQDKFIVLYKEYYEK